MASKPELSCGNCYVHGEFIHYFSNPTANLTCRRCSAASHAASSNGSENNQIETGPLILYYKDDHNKNCMKIAETPNEIIEAFEQKLAQLGLKSNS